MDHRFDTQAADAGRRRCPRAKPERAAIAGALSCVLACAPDTLAVVGSFDAGGPERDNGARDSSVIADVCLGRLAAQTFQNALCTCGSVVLTTGGLRSDAFDSRAGPYTPTSALVDAGDVGIVGSLAATETFADAIRVGGNLTVGSALGPVLLPALSIGGDLRVAGTFAYANPVDVGGDLWLASDLDGAAVLHVAGDLRQAAGASRRSSAALTIDGRDLRGALNVPAPCACERDQHLDVDALVAEAKLHNDNAANGFSEHSLSDVVAVGRSVLEGGRIFASGIGVGGSLDLIVNGNCALFVEGNVDVAGLLQIELGPDGALDLFVAGDFTQLGQQTLGASRAAQLRIYVAREQRVTLGLPGGFVGNLYAPESDVFMTGTSDVYGSIVAHSLAAPTPLSIHYDRALADEAQRCPPR